MMTLDKAAGELCQVREWLLRPSADTLDACGPALERAAVEVAGLVQNPPSQKDPSLWIAATRLAAEISRVRTLLEAAGALYFGRLKRLSESADG